MDLTPNGIADLRELLLHLSHTSGMTILISSHILSELEQITTCFGILHDGEIVKEVSTQDVSQNRNTLEELYLQYNQRRKITMANVLKSDLYRFGKSKLFYGIAAFTGMIAFLLIMLIHQDIRLGVSVLGDLTAFRKIDDIIRIGVEYHKGLGILVAVLISVFYRSGISMENMAA